MGVSNSLLMGQNSDRIAMTEIPEDVKKAAKAGVSKWLGESEGFAIRQERVPPEAMAWVETAWALALISKTDEATKVLQKWRVDQYMKLHAGEMSAQEVRTVKAVLNGIIWEIRNGDS